MFDLCLDNWSDREEGIMSQHEIEKTVSKSSVFHDTRLAEIISNNYLFCGPSSTQYCSRIAVLSPSQYFLSWSNTWQQCDIHLSELQKWFSTNLIFFGKDTWRLDSMYYSGSILRRDRERKPVIRLPGIVQHSLIFRNPRCAWYMQRVLE